MHGHGSMLLASIGDDLLQLVLWQVNEHPHCNRSLLSARCTCKAWRVLAAKPLPIAAARCSQFHYLFQGEKMAEFYLANMLTTDIRPELEEAMSSLQPAQRSLALNLVRRFEDGQHGILPPRPESRAAVAAALAWFCTKDLNRFLVMAWPANLQLWANACTQVGVEAIIIPNASQEQEQERVRVLLQGLLKQSDPAERAIVIIVPLDTEGLEAGLSEERVLEERKALHRVRWQYIVVDDPRMQGPVGKYTRWIRSMKWGASALLIEEPARFDQLWFLLQMDRCHEPATGGAMSLLADVNRYCFGDFVLQDWAETQVMQMIWSVLQRQMAVEVPRG